MGVFNESIMVKMEFEVTMGVYGERPWAMEVLVTFTSKIKGVLKRVYMKVGLYDSENLL